MERGLEGGVSVSLSKEGGHAGQKGLGGLGAHSKLHKHSGFMRA